MEVCCGPFTAIQVPKKSAVASSTSTSMRARKWLCNQPCVACVPHHAFYPAVFTAPKCAGSSTDLLHPIPARLHSAWLAPYCPLHEPCDPEPTPSKVLAAVFLQNRVPVHPKDVIASAGSQDFANKGELGLRTLAKLCALAHCSDDVCFAKSWSAIQCRDPSSTPTEVLLVRWRPQPKRELRRLAILAGHCHKYQ